MMSMHLEASMQIFCRGLFQEYYDLLQRQPRLEFASPGGERQDSVYNGLQVGFNQCQETIHQRCPKLKHFWQATPGYNKT